jgi:SpoVK/Ycf46/Vps4 family AAA+-type ATPase
MTKRFIEPLLAARDRLEHGKPLPADTPSSAIFYGPPGTSKTELAILIAKSLGWPLLALDPSHLTRQGLDQVHAEANKLFSMLQQCERIVVLLDEFDELMRDREGKSDLESRFLTTAMLPKLTALSKERCLVYLVATNHLERFDAAIRRPGRFDLIVPVMPPTLQAKRVKWPDLAAALEKIGTLGEEELAESKAALSDLTFSETKDLAKQIEGNDDPGKLSDAFVKAGKDCTLRQQVASDAEDGGGDGTWRTQILDQRGRIRLGG